MAKLHTVYAIHTFEAENDDEIAFAAGEPVIVFETDEEYNDGWWQGQNVKGELGLFPKNYTSPYLPPHHPYKDTEEIPKHPRTSTQVSPRTIPQHTPSLHPMASTQHISSNHLSLPHINIPSNASTRSHTPSLLSNSYQNLQASVLNSLYAPQLQGTSPEEWTIEQVAIWLDIIGFSTVAYTFKAQEITGDILLELTLDTLKELNVTTFGKRFKLHNAIQALGELRHMYKLVSSRESHRSKMSLEDSASIKNHGRSTARSIENGRTHPTQTSRMHSIIPEHSMDHFFPDKTDSPFSAPKSAPPSMHTASVYDTTPVQRHRLPSISNSISNDTVNLDKEYAKLQRQSAVSTHSSITSPHSYPIPHTSQHENHTQPISVPSSTLKLRYQSILTSLKSNAKQPAEAHVVANHPASGMEDYSSESKTMPEMQGWLHKQSERYRTWNKRWFALRGSNLFYYKAQDSHIKGIIHLQGYRIIYDGNMYTGKYAFKLHHEHERTFFLYTDTEAMMRSWTKAFIKATIVRNVSVPVKSSSTVLTISLNDAKRMNPRPPSMLFYAKQKNPHTLTHRPVSEISEEVTQPIMRMSVSEDAAMYRSHDKDAYPKDYLADTAWGFENTTESPTKDSGFISAHHTHGIHAHESFYEEDEEDLIDPLHKSGVTLYVPHFSKPLPSPPREHDWFHWRSYQWVHWINTHSPQKIKVLSDLQKGESLIFLLEGLSGKTVKRSWSKQNESVAQALDKIGSALRFMEKETIVADGQYNVEDIHGASDIKMIEMLGLVRLWYETKILKERSIADDTTLGRH